MANFKKPICVVHEHLPVHVCAHMSWPRVGIQFYCSHRSFAVNLELTNWAASSKDPPVSAFPVLRVQAHITMLSLLIWVLMV